LSEINLLLFNETRHSIHVNKSLGKVISVSVGNLLFSWWPNRYWGYRVT